MLKFMQTKEQQQQQQAMMMRNKANNKWSIVHSRIIMILIG